MNPTLSPELVGEVAIAQGVCARPVISRVTNLETGEVCLVPIWCGSTREDRCPACAERARRLRMQQCREGWHLDTEPEWQTTDDDGQGDELGDDQAVAEPDCSRRVRSTRRRQDAPDLPRVPAEDRTVGRVFTAPSGKTYRPSMFVTLTLGSYGRVTAEGVPVNPETYDYRRAALDALHFPKLVDRFWQNLRRCAGYRVQYFAAVERSGGWRPTCTRRSGGRFLARSCVPSGRRPITRSGGPPTRSPSTRTGSHSGPTRGMPTRRPVPCWRLGRRHSTHSTRTPMPGRHMWSG